MNLLHLPVIDQTIVGHMGIEFTEPVRILSVHPMPVDHRTINPWGSCMAARP